MHEIKLSGQGGQGVVAAGELIAIAANIEGKFCRVFPLYGPQRRGAPVLAFAQIGDEAEATRSMIYNPGYILILDPMMPKITDTTTGLRSGGAVIYNTRKPIEEALTLFKAPIGVFATIDATSIASQVIGRPIPNTVMLGAFAKTTGLLRVESIINAIERRFPPNLASPNVELVRAGYASVEIRKLEVVL